MITTTLLLVWAASQAGSSKNSSALLGADEVLRRVAAGAPQKVGADPFTSARAESATLIGRLPTLTPSQAADAWVKLEQAWETAADKSPNPNPNPNGESTDHWGEIMMAPLPEPAAWSLMHDRLAKLPATAKRKAAIGLVDDLLGRDAQVLRYLESKRNPDSDPDKEDVFDPNHLISAAEEPIADRSGNLDVIEKIYTRRVLANQYEPWDAQPNLVRIFGAKRAASIIRKVVESPTPIWSTFGGKETQDLARSIVLSDITNVKQPQWGLVRGIDDFAFVSAQVSHFGEDALRNSGSNQGADLIYGLRIARSGDLSRAEKFLDSITDDSVDLKTFVKPGPDRVALFDLVSKLLDRAPIDAIWTLYEDLGRSLGRMDEVEVRLAGWLNGKRIAADRFPMWLVRRAAWDLANGRTDQAIAEYESAIKLKYSDPVSKLLDVAALVGDHKALDFVAKAAKGMGTDANRLNLFRAYVDQGRISDAQNELLSAAANVHNVNLSAEGNGRLLNADIATGKRLAELYYRRNEPDEILTLLHEYPRWGAPDLAGLIGDRSSYDYSDHGQAHEIGFYAAWALSKTGQSARAIPILSALAPDYPKDKDASDLLSRLKYPGMGEPMPATASDALRERARDLEYSGLYSMAIDLFQKALSAEPFDREAEAGIASCLKSLGKPDEARTAILKAIDLMVEGHGSTARFGLVNGWNYSFSEDGEAIDRELEVLRQSHPHDPGVRFAIAQFDAGSNDFKGALASYEEAVAIDPKYLDAWDGIAGLWSKDVASPEQIREAVLKLIDSDPLSWSNYETVGAIAAFADKSPLWIGFSKAKFPPAPSAAVSLFPLEASRKSLASGTHPLEDRGAADAPARTPGAVLGEIPEVRALFP